MKITIIRHFKTQGNVEGRFIGTTDEHILSEKIPKDASQYPEADAVVITATIKCGETAKLIYPEVPMYMSGKLKECDYGLLENKKYEDLKEYPWFRQWEASFGNMPFPAGEPRESFRKRTLRGFCEAVDMLIEKGVGSAAFIAGGGTIATIMETYGKPRKKEYQERLDNGAMYQMELNEEQWKQGVRELLVL